ncbi:BON domain-containing protein [Idiomarina xiamenensis]|uniref:Osmotically-inducible protein Y n=1 Tax=Idiomarina xiamenensis 10-D-4 TaxID=740709 RepID=K2JHQ0_9GAMM|nr:BON domain-containing protein [Idiomarina xiamenensis]EKE82911.1 hypothetical protein A10D4_08729 [Idiomarina xiamenensis 10-D-4]
MKQRSKLLTSGVMALSVLTLAACSEAQRDSAEQKSEQAMESAEQTANDVADSAKKGMNEAGEYIDDSVITARVKAKLMDDDNLDNSDISVETTDGVVSLTGTVAKEADIDTAENLTEMVEGVKSVENELKVGN